MAEILVILQKCAKAAVNVAAIMGKVVNKLLYSVKVIVDCLGTSLRL